MNNTAEPPTSVVGSAGAREAIYALVLLCLVNAFNYFDRSILGLLLPLMRRDLHLSDTVVGLVTGVVFALINVTLTLPIASLADRFNRRNIVAAGLAFWSAMVALTGFVTSVWGLEIGRAHV